MELVQKQSLEIIGKSEILGKRFKIYGTFENPLILAKNVAEWIEHKDVSTMVRTVDVEEKVTNNVCTLGGIQKMLLLTEDGVYEVLMQSRKPIAKEFKREVKKILRSVRQNGMYVKDELLDNPDLLSDVIHKLKEEKTQRQKLENKIAIDAPKVEQHDRFMNTDKVYDMSEVAKLLDINIGRNKLFKFLRIHNVLMSDSEHKNHPYQSFAKYFKQILTHCRQDGSPVMQTFVKPVGVDFIYKKLKEDGLMQPIIYKPSKMLAVLERDSEIVKLGVAETKSITNEATNNELSNILSQDKDTIMQDLNKGMYKSIILQAYKQKENSPSWFGKEYLEHLLGVYTDIIHNESKMTWNVIDVDIIKLKHYFGVNEVSL